jgi:hypothetical protein
VVVRPLVGGPLRWVHLLVWREVDVGREGDALRDVSLLLFEAAVTAYQELMAETPAYREWLTRHPTFGPAV